MIRFATPADERDLLELAKSLELFGPEELAEVQAMLADYFEESTQDGSQDRVHSGEFWGEFWLVDEANTQVIGAAYCAPERMTNGTWNLLFIGIHPDAQGKGHGTALIRYVEAQVAKRGAHLLLVETLADFEHTRAFYRRCGYTEAAQIDDYYDVGAHKVIYRKDLRE